MNNKKNKLILYLLFSHLIIFIALIIISLNHWLAFLILIIISFLINAFIINKFVKNNNENINRYKTLETSISVMDKTISYLRQGLNPTTAYEVANIIKSISNAPAVAITDRDNILAFVGVGCENHPIGYPIRTQATKNAISSGELKIINSKKDFNCNKENCNCPLESAIIVPLYNKNVVIGTLKFYDTKKGLITDEKIKFASGLAKLLNIYIDITDLERQSQLATVAKLDALQAQVNPHFLYNALNTINMYINKNPSYARKLVVKLSMLLRYLLGSNGRFISLDEEISYIKDYTAFEIARFEDKLNIVIDIDPDLKDLKIPVFTIQPLVQNAIIHGLLPKDNGGTITVTAVKTNDELNICVSDNGIGIEKSELDKIFCSGYGKGLGIGISNVNERLILLYGEKYSLKIESVYNQGTKASFSIPNIKKEGIT